MIRRRGNRLYSVVADEEVDNGDNDAKKGGAKEDRERICDQGGNAESVHHRDHKIYKKSVRGEEGADEEVEMRKGE